MCAHQESAILLQDCWEKNKRSKKEITNFSDPKLTGEQEHEKGGAVDGSMDAAG